jgi:hypothetical protein
MAMLSIDEIKFEIESMELYAAEISSPNSLEYLLAGLETELNRPLTMTEIYRITTVWMEG